MTKTKTNGAHNNASHHESIPAQDQVPKNGDYPTMEVYLSRTEFRLGTAVVGTVRLLPLWHQLPRSCFTSATVQVFGKCRIDPRWHNASSYCTRNGIPLVDDEEDCIVWASNVVDLLRLPERQVGKWRHVRPRPLYVPPDNPELYFTEASLSFISSSSNGESKHMNYDEDQDPALILENQQLTFTFRANLSEYLTPTVSLTCCRYYYHVQVHATTCDGLVIGKVVPFTVLSNLHGGSRPTKTHLDNGITRLGSCVAMAHSSGLPCYVSADEIYAPQGHTTVTDYKSKWDTNTMRVADPSGSHCCILTVVGSTTMSPGVGHLLLQFDFEESSHCNLVSACLEGYETAIRSYDGRGEYRTRTHLLDANHDFVEPGYTQRVPLLLHLPPDCPITVETDLVRVEVFCRVDITITKLDKYSSLRLTLPIRVVHSAKAEEMEEPEDEEDNIESMNELLLHDSRKDPTPTSELFETKDILHELKILSLLLVEKCNLLPEDLLF